jgi:flagellin
MSLNVISNYAANVALRTLQRSDSEATSSLSKLSAGTRVLSAKDDAASLAIGSRLRADVAALRAASINAGQASSMLQIADGAMSVINDTLVRMKVLATQSASGQVTDTERGMLQTEFASLQAEIDRVTDTTRFSDQVLLKGEGASAPAAVARGIKLFAGGLQTNIDGTGTNANAGPTATLRIGGTQLANLSTSDKFFFQTQGGEQISVALAGTESTVQDIANTLNADASFQKVAASAVNANGDLTIRSLPGVTSGGSEYTKGQLPQIVTARLDLAGFTKNQAAAADLEMDVKSGGDIDTDKLTEGVRAGDVLRFTYQDGSKKDVTISSANVTAGKTNIGILLEAAKAVTDTAYDLSTSSLTDEDTIKFTTTGDIDGAGTTAKLTDVSFFSGGVSTLDGTKTGQTDIVLKQGVGTIDLGSAALVAGDKLNFDQIDATGKVTAKSYTITGTGDTSIDGLVAKLNANALATAGAKYEFSRTGASTIQFSSTLQATDSAGGEYGVYSIRNVQYKVGTSNTTGKSFVDINFGGRTLQDGDVINFTIGGEARTLTLDSARTGLSVDSIVDFISANATDGKVGYNVTASNVDGMLRIKTDDSDNQISTATYTATDGTKMSSSGGNTAGADGSSGLEITFHVGSYTTASDAISVRINNVSTTSLGVAAADQNITSRDDATAAMEAINGAVNKLQSARALVGAQQNRLEYASQALGAQAENMEAARSNLLDLDVAAEMSAFTSKSILQQAGVSMLAQANQMPRNLLRLFQ